MNETIKTAAIAMVVIVGICAICLLAVMATREQLSRNAQFEAREQQWQDAMQKIMRDCEGPADIKRETVIVYQVERLVLTQVVAQPMPLITHPWGDNHPLFKKPDPYTNFFDWLRDHTNALPIEYTTNITVNAL